MILETAVDRWSLPEKADDYNIASSLILAGWVKARLVRRQAARVVGHIFKGAPKKAWKSYPWTRRPGKENLLRRISAGLGAGPGSLARSGVIRGACWWQLAK